MVDRVHHVPFCRSVRAEFVGDDTVGLQAQLLQQSDQQMFGNFGIVASLDDSIENGGSLKPMVSTAD